MTGFLDLRPTEESLIIKAKNRASRKEAKENTNMDASMMSSETPDIAEEDYLAFCDLHKIV